MTGTGRQDKQDAITHLKAYIKFPDTLMCIVMFFFALVLFSCREEQRHEETKLPEIKKDSFFLNFTDVSTALKIVPLKQLPSGFHLDSVFKTDTLLNHQTTLYYPVSETDPSFNRRLRLFIEKQEKGYRPYEKGDEYESSFFDLWLVAEEYSGKKQRFTFWMQSYYPGAAHYNHDSAVFTALMK